MRRIEHNTHPGEIIFHEIIKPNDLTIKKTASLLGITRYKLSNIINGKSAIAPQMAIRISKVFGGNADLWLRLQVKYDLRKAEKEWKSKNLSLQKFEFY